MKTAKIGFGFLLIVLGILMIAMSGCGDMTETSAANTEGVTVAQNQTATPAQPEEPETPEPVTEYRIMCGSGTWQIKEGDIETHREGYIQFRFNGKTISVHGSFVVEEL